MTELLFCSRQRVVYNLLDHPVIACQPIATALTLAADVIDPPDALEGLLGGGQESRAPLPDPPVVVQRFRIELVVVALKRNDDLARYRVRIQVSSKVLLQVLVAVLPASEPILQLLCSQSRGKLQHKLLRRHEIFPQEITGRRAVYILVKSK